MRRGAAYIKLEALQAHDALLESASRQQPVHIDRPVLPQPMCPVHCLWKSISQTHVFDRVAGVWGVGIRV